MKLNRTRSSWKIWVGAVLGVLLLADVALAYVVWQFAQSGPDAMRSERARLQVQDKLLKADINRAQAIRRHMPDVGKECDRFYQDEFLPVTTGYSDVLSDLGAIANKAGLQTSGITFHQKELAGRGVTEIAIATDVEGSYPSIIQFIDGLEQSKKLYLVDNLRLSSQNANNIRLNLEIRTYFRS